VLDQLRITLIAELLCHSRQQTRLGLDFTQHSTTTS
jgi:hypothetical protein